MFKITIHPKLSPDLMRRQAEYWQNMAAAWDRCELSPDDDLNTVVFKLYMRMQDVEAIRRELRKMGVARFQSSADVTRIIECEHIADQELESYVRDIQRGNRSYALSRT